MVQPSKKNTLKNSFEENVQSVVPMQSESSYLAIIAKRYFHIPIFLVFYLGIATLFVVSHAEGIKEPFVTFPNWLSMYLGIFSVLFLYFPFLLGRLELHINAIHFSRKPDDTELGKLVLAGTIVFLSILFYVHVFFDMIH